MLFDYTFFLSNFDSAFFSGNEHIGEFIIPLHKEVIGKKPEVFKLLQHSKNRFCFFIPYDITKYDNGYIREEIIQHMIRLMFLPNYMKVNASFVLFIDKLNEGNEKFNALKQLFHDQLSKQGIRNVTIEAISMEALFASRDFENGISFVHSELNDYLESNFSQENFDLFKQKFVFPHYFDKKWIVPVSCSKNFYDKTKQIGEFEKWLREFMPLMVGLVEKYKFVKQHHDKLCDENSLLQFKLANSANYLQLIREEAFGFMAEIASLRGEVKRLTNQILYPENPLVIPVSGPSGGNEELISNLEKQIIFEQNRANATLEWYLKEYEVLPLWFKRFGHIIKVAKGKRSFKSLFEKNQNDQRTKSIK